METSKIVAGFVKVNLCLPLDLGNQPHSDEFKKKRNLIKKLFFSSSAMFM